LNPGKSDAGERIPLACFNPAFFIFCLVRPMAHNDLLVRTVNFPEDYASVLELWAHAGEGIQIRRSDEPLEMLKKVRRDPDLFLAAEINGRIIGAVLGGFDGRRGLVYHLAVDSSCRRKGIARRLMQELEQRLMQKGCVKYYLLVTRDNTDALQFYEEIGCEVMDLRILGKNLP